MWFLTVTFFTFVHESQYSGLHLPYLNIQPKFEFKANQRDLCVQKITHRIYPVAGSECIIGMRT